MNVDDLLASLHLDPAALKSGDLVVTSPIDGAEIARVATDTAADVDAKIAAAAAAFQAWRTVPAPRRGELIRLFGDALRARKEPLGRLVTLESGKIAQEGLGEVQEMIDICDYAVGLSRQLYGLTIASERPGHRMMETWHPMGVCGVISAFNFPVAVWAWNAALAIVCGDAVVWKPSEMTPLTALACQRLFARAAERFAAEGHGGAPPALSQIVVGGRAVGERLVDDARVPVISATGSCRMGAAVAPRVAARFGRSILELGGNNAMIVAPSADLDLAERAILFSAVGTAGQRCTSLRRLIVHESIRATLVERLQRAYGDVPIGAPDDAAQLMGPLINGGAFDAMQAALDRARADGGRVTGGERQLAERYPNAWYVTPAIVEMPAQTEIVETETFRADPLCHGLRGHRPGDRHAQRRAPGPVVVASSRNDVREAEQFLSATGSDCGIANVNIGPSGAEIGGAFGGEKETGGGRESGSDAWRGYMRRQTNTINYSRDLPLAQGINFGG